MKTAPFVFIILQGITLTVYNFIYPMFNISDISSYYLICIIILTFVFYGFTSFRDPGYLKRKSEQLTELSHQMTQKPKLFNFELFTSNARTYPVTEQQIQSPHENEEQKENDLQCEASIDENQLPQFDLNQVPSFHKTPDKELSPIKPKSSQKKQEELQPKHLSTQAFSLASTNNDEIQMIPIQSDMMSKNSKDLSPVFIKREDRQSIQIDNQSNLVLQMQIRQTNINQQQNDILSEQHSPGTQELHTINIGTNQKNKLYIEKRYCFTCQVDQIVRSKHCQSCNRCVALYDHHCPWTGNCIGERNKCVFYWFLVFQIQEIYYITICSLLHLEFNTYSIVFQILTIIVILISLFFLILVTSLLCFHSFIMFQNLTTWEYYSWNKISYLKDLQKKKGSPFSIGIWKNLKIYCRCSIETLTQWEYNPEKV